MIVIITSEILTKERELHTFANKYWWLDDRYYRNLSASNVPDDTTCSINKKKKGQSTNFFRRGAG